MKKITFLAAVLFTAALEAQENCINFSDYTDDYVSLVGTDDDTYPAGTIFMEAGDLKLEKPLGETNYLSTSSDEFFFVGDVDINTNTFECENKKLTFSIATAPENGISVDGVIISDEFADFPEVFDGGTFEYIYDGISEITITGEFEIVSLFGSTNTLSNVCLECVSDGSCFDFTAYDNDYLMEISDDDVAYPEGYVFMESGPIKLLKKGEFSVYMGTDGNELTYFGNLMIDVSDAECEDKTLSFTSIYTELLIVDEDTIFFFGAIPTTYDSDVISYTGDPMTGEFTISGDFDLIELGASTNILSDLCFECSDEPLTVFENQLNELRLFPNPTSDNTRLVFESANGGVYQLQLTDLSGKIVFATEVNSAQLSTGYQLDLSQTNSGIYMVSLSNDDGQVQQKIIRQ